MTSLLLYQNKQIKNNCINSIILILTCMVTANRVEYCIVQIFNVLLVISKDKTLS